MAEIRPLILDTETVEDLWLMYKGAFANMIDADRSYDSFRNQVLHESSQFFHVGENVVIFLTQINMVPRAAVFHVLSKGTWDLKKPSKEFRDALREIMDMFAILRLTAMVPAVRQEVGQLMEYLGFTPEGVFRKYLEYNSEVSDIGFYGLLREDLDATQSKASSLLKRAGVA